MAEEGSIRFAFRLYAAALLCLSIVPAPCKAQATPADAPIVQPGAPGHSNKTLTAATAAGPHREPSEADVKFMQDMIMHHGQAVEMTELLKTRSHNTEVQAIGDRINVSQTDELRYMKQWLQDRGKPLASEHDSMAGMDMSGMDMADMAMMPGMLTPRQMDTLRKSTGSTFDHLFLTGMIQHHTGAVNMVKQLFNTQGAGQDPQLFDFANDVDNTQLAEIDFMQHMLKKEHQ
ncbi:DUF305 domain-containing protein [Granulicella arctica]|uniref:DUF305 domain-containing protein n=1 Tax=Granulicella arctica TaxID=940613 RepID=UPI0021E00774|nr:DUF305 domain-containing protein [Granulicella arctica]